MDTLNSNKKFFIYYKPKDIVSGDFYFATSHKHNDSDTEKFYLCTADCTGHGVPGAFMSMLNISYLNESILEKGISQPHKILDNIRNSIISSLNPEGSSEEAKDGMDCVLCCFDFEKNELDYAAANNSFYVIRDGALIHCEADKMPVGMHSEMKPFTLKKFILKPHDVIYTFTDGLADQFGGPKGKKFKYKQLEELLLEIYKKPMEEQKRLIHERFENWKGNLEQIDDVLIIGIRI